MIDIGEPVSGSPLFEAPAVLVLAYTLGAIMGPLVGAAAMQWWNPLGFPMLLLTVSTLGWLSLTLSRRRDASREVSTAWP